MEGGYKDFALKWQREQFAGNDVIGWLIDWRQSKRSYGAD